MLRDTPKQKETQAIKTGSVPQKVNHPHKRTSGQSIANHVGPHCPLSIFIPHNQDYEAMFKDQKNCHKETCHAQVTSQAHTWRVPVAPFLHIKKIIPESIVKHKYKHNQTSFSERKAIKTGPVPSEG